MSILEFSGKVVESAANLNEKKLEVSIDLLNIYYNKKDGPVNLDVVIKDYNYIYEELKNLKAPEQSQEILGQHKKAFKILSAVIILFLIIFSIIVYKIGIHQIFAYFTS